jgi:hypothetical protein
MEYMARKLTPSANKICVVLIILKDIINKDAKVQGHKNTRKLRKVLNTYMSKMAMYVSFEDFEK